MSYHIITTGLAWHIYKSTSRPRYNKTVKNTPKTKKYKQLNKTIKQRLDHLNSHVSTLS